MKDVLINVCGSQTDETGDEDVIEFTTIGKYSKGKDGYKLQYPENITTGFENVTTTLCINEDLVSLRRRGKINSDLTVQHEKRHICHYDTGFGYLNIGVYGQDISYNLSKDGGEIFMQYTIDIDSKFTSENKIHVTVRNA